MLSVGEAEIIKMMVAAGPGKTSRKGVDGTRAWNRGRLQIGENMISRGSFQHRVWIWSLALLCPGCMTSDEK